MGQNGFEPISYGFCDDFVNNIAKGNGSVVTRRGGVIFVRNKAYMSIVKLTRVTLFVKSL
jgi:hypothetical protein